MLEEYADERKNGLAIYVIDRQTDYRSIKYFCNICHSMTTINTSTMFWDFACPECGTSFVESKEVHL